MTIYYKVIEVWCEYPFQSVIDYRYCIFSFSRKKFKQITDLIIDSTTSIKEKEEYLKLKLDLEKVKIIKL
jgi:hypothetical protein